MGVRGHGDHQDVVAERGEEEGGIEDAQQEQAGTAEFPEENAQHLREVSHQGVKEHVGRQRMAGHEVRKRRIRL